MNSVLIVKVPVFLLVSCRRRKEKQLQDMMLKVKRHSVTGQLPPQLELTLLESPFSETTDDEVDLHHHHVREHSSPSRYVPGGPNMERALSFASTPSRVRRRLPKRKRRISNTRDESAGPTTLDPDAMDSRRTLLPQSPPHVLPSLLWKQTTPTEEAPNGELVGHSASGESTPRLLPTHHESTITPEGDLSPAVAEFLESVKHPIHIHHNVHRSSSNGSLRTHRRQGSNGSTHSCHNPSPLSRSPVKGPSHCNSTSSLSRSRRAPEPQEHTSSRRGSGSGIQYSKLDSSSSEDDDKERETGTQSSDHNTVSASEEMSQSLKTSKKASEDRHLSCVQRKDGYSSSRDVYSNESSGDARCSDGGHDADRESDGNSLDLLSELETNPEPNDSNLDSLHSLSNVESSDVTSTTPDILDSDSTVSLIPKSKTSVPHSPGHNVAMLITQFESSHTSSDSSPSNSQSSHYQMEMPVHLRRDSSVPLTGSYSLKTVEDYPDLGELKTLT